MFKSIISEKDICPGVYFGKMFVQLFILVFAKLETDGLGLSWPLLKVGTKPDGLSISFHSTFLCLFSISHTITITIPSLMDYQYLFIQLFFVFFSISHTMTITIPSLMDCQYLFIQLFFAFFLFLIQSFRVCVVY